MTIWKVLRADGSLKTIRLLFFGLVLLEFLLPSPVQATNGLNLIDSGGISTALAGADTAVATDFSSMNTNPAGMSQIPDSHFGISVGVLQAKLRHIDSLNDKDSVNGPLIIPNMGYIRRLKDTPITLGIGFFSVGGTASEFDYLRTQFGTTDKTGIQLRNFKVTPSIAYQVNDKLSVGATLALTYSDVQLTVLPNTAVPGVFAGFETKGNCDRANGLGALGSCAYAINITPKIGAMYKPDEVWTFGIAYTFKTMLPFANGRLTRNIGGLGKVNYDVDVSGFKWADDLAVGIAYRPNKALLVALKFQWINWDAAMNNVTLNLKNGDNPLATTGSIVLSYNWRDQYVTAIGATYDLTEKLNIRGGYNFGNNPVPKSTVDPTNANIVEHHLTGGAAYWLNDDLRLESAFTYALTNCVTYDSALYGNNSTLEVGGYQLTFTLSYRPAAGFGFLGAKPGQGG